MKRVKQFTIDIMINENVNESKFAEQIAKDLENEGYMVLGSDFQMDMTKEYKLYYPELSTGGFRTVKITAGMTQEFEIISTNAPDSVIKANLQYINTCEENGEKIENPYAVIEAMGFIVNCLGCQDDFDSEDMKSAIIDAEFDFYDIGSKSVDVKEEKNISFEIEHYNGNTYLAFEAKITKDGNVKVVKTQNCSHADTDGDYIFSTNNDLVRMQADEPISKDEYDNIWDCYHENEVE